ncbi:MAG: glycosyltransferase family 2 protein [Saprospiraceae bacterium]
MPKNRPLISIISVDYNQLAVTCEMLDSLRLLSYTNIEIIVVDNASKVDPTAHLQEHYPEAKVIRSEENLGFAGGNNLAIVESKGEYLFFVNNDTELTPNIIEPLLTLFDEIPTLGIVCPKICYHPSTNNSKVDLIQYMGSTEVSPYTARNKTLGEMEEDQQQYTGARPTAYAHGAAMMITRSAIEQVGLMPEDFFLYYEELDWCEQFKRAGYSIYVEPKAKIYHKESVSVGGNMSTLKTHYLTRNRILFMRRNKTAPQVFLFSLFLIFFTIPKNVFVYLLRGEFQLLKAFWKGIWWHVSNRSHLPSRKMVADF